MEINEKSPSGWCLAANAKISMLDGTIATISELVGKEEPKYSSKSDKEPENLRNG